MARKSKVRLELGTRKLATGTKGRRVSDLQALLSRYGYLRGAYTPGEFCGCTERAVRRYQRYYGLKPDGVVGPITRTQLERPRCGVPDVPFNAAGMAAGAFVLRGCRYPRNAFTYTFQNGTDDLPGTREKEILAQAFQAWAAVADLGFSEGGAGADFTVAWAEGDHGDGSSFDGTGGPGSNTLAHAFFPPPCGGIHAGALHFDEAERWIDDPTADGILLLQVAIHEIGHLLGLSHSQDESAIMYAYYAPDRVQLAADDVAGIQTLYGEPGREQHLTLKAEVADRLGATGGEARYVIPVARLLNVTVEGPADADFDLYIRTNEPPTESLWDYRAYTVSANEQVTFAVDDDAVEYHVLVRSYEGSGDFTLRVEASGIEQ